MEIEYMQSHDRKYLILQGSWDTGKDFEAEMLKKNRVRGLLQFYKKETDRNKEYYYDITGLRSLESVMENRCFTGEELCRMLFGVRRVLEEAEALLLDLRGLVFTPQLLFVKGEDPEQVFFCYLPGQESTLMEGLQELFRYVLTKIDHEEKETMMLGYELYRVSMEENQGMETLLKIAGDFLDARREAEEQAARQEEAALETPKKKSSGKWFFRKRGY